MILNCKRCGKPFERHCQRHVYCAACAAERGRAGNRKGATADVTKTCPVCGQTFATKFHSKVYCSVICRNNNESKQAAFRQKAGYLSLTDLRLARKAAREAMAARLAARDAAYEAACPGLQSGNVRGRIAAGGRIVKYSLNTTTI